MGTWVGSDRSRMQKRLQPAAITSGDITVQYHAEAVSALSLLYVDMLHGLYSKKQHSMQREACNVQHAVRLCGVQRTVVHTSVVPPLQTARVWSSHRSIRAAVVVALRQPQVCIVPSAGWRKGTSRPQMPLSNSN